MTEPGLILVTGAGGGVGGVGGKVVALLRQRGRAVRAMAHHDDDRADALRALGADVVAGDLTRPEDVATALDSVERMFFSMSLSPALLEAATTVATVARAVGTLDALVAISQLTVSQMDALSMSESHHQRAALAVGTGAELVRAAGHPRSPDRLLGYRAVHDPGRAVHCRPRRHPAPIRER